MTPLLKAGFKGVFFKSIHVHEYFFTNVPRRFKTFFIVEDMFLEKSDGMKNYLDSEIDLRKKSGF